MYENHIHISIPYIFLLKIVMRLMSWFFHLFIHSHLKLIEMELWWTFLHFAFRHRRQKRWKNLNFRPQKKFPNGMKIPIAEVSWREQKIYIYMRIIYLLKTLMHYMKPSIIHRFPRAEGNHWSDKKWITKV